MWLVCKRGKCNQFSSINTFWNVNLRISQLKQTDSEGRVEIDFDSRVKVSMLECELAWSAVLHQAPLSPLLSDIDLESRTLSLLSDQIYCYNSTRTVGWFCNYYPVFVSRGPFEIFLSEENNKWNMYLFI